MATYVITEACIGVKDATCVDVCPVACIHTTPDAPMYYIDPDICIACEQCFIVCPVNAIYLDSDVPEHLRHYLEINAEFFRENKERSEATVSRSGQDRDRCDRRLFPGDGCGCCRSFRFRRKDRGRVG